MSLPISEVIKTVGFHLADEFGEIVVEVVEDHIQIGARNAL